MNFGPRQLKNPTPGNIVFWVRVYTVVAGIVLTSLASAPFHLSHEAFWNWFLSLTITISNGVAPLFGVPISTKTVPADQVVAMDEPKE